MSLRIGVDIGGSYTDFAVLDEETRDIRTLKVFSRPDQPGSEVIAGMQGLIDRYGIDPADVGYFTHGTTVGVNAVVQRRGLKLALITTARFEDVLEIARLKIPDPYHLYSSRPEPLVPRDRVFGIVERVLPDGRVDTPVDEASVRQALEQIMAMQCEGIVVSLLHSYRNPDNEIAVRDIIRRVHPGMFVSCSHEVWPIIREYERTTTALIGGYVQPKVADYLTSLQKALLETGVTSELKVTKSNGGVMSAENGKTNCVQMILSGTASGVIGAAYVANQCGIGNCMSLDIGGTTADVALIVDGQPQYASGEYIGDFQIHIPSVSVTSIGDGGGSIAWVDDYGVLKVGPHSAGSTPGPACFGRGGTAATITDAFAVMGVLGQAELGYNSVKVDVEASRRVVGELARKLGESVEHTAESIVRVSVSGMYAGVNRLISRFGIDPRVFTLMPFGGAGPMLGCYLARALNMPGVMVPTTPGVLSALGGLIADTKNDFVKTTYYDLSDETAGRLKHDLDELERQARAWMADQGAAHADPRLLASADMRYQGQSFEIDTALPLDAIVRGDAQALRDAFHREHARLYGHSDPQSPVQIVALRLVIVSETPKPALRQIARATEPLQARATARVWMDDAWLEVPLYLRGDLRAGHTFEGPAIVAQDDTTTCVLPGFSASVDTYGNLFLNQDVAHAAKD
ncbi:hydantoin utilization protein A [Bordetella ansorpii]|uniref:Hydantoin utilization protein A n=1 Tax=Bordetella ansorpii TaxID=288768 RepID=A0A157RCJ8_9BORD|nr:hydantoinase/oxoprolinase family protein [Bordetella ansorpii]SAI55755.1 hydantoin utilization protein A [Bordetella ansorpii]